MILNTLIIGDRAGQRLDNFLFQIYKSTPNSHVYRMIRKGRIRVNGKPCKDNTYKLCQDDVILMPTPINDVSHVTPSDAVIEKVKSMIVHESDDFWLLNKTQGICVHQSERDGFGVVEVMRHIYGDAHLVHRIDRNTSGCLIVAKSYTVLSRLQSYWRNANVDKYYWLLSEGEWASGEKRLVTEPLLRVDAKQGGAKVITSDKGKSARTEFKLIKQYHGYCLLQAKITTGRTHQIRVHAAFIGLPIVGDGRYGKAKNPHVSMMFLHARQLIIPDEDINFKAALSEEQTACLRRLDLDS